MRRWVLGTLVGVLLVAFHPLHLRAQAGTGLEGALSGIVGGSFTEFEERFPFSPNGAIQARVSYSVARVTVGVVGELGLTGISWGISCPGGGACPNNHDLQWDRHQALGASLGVWMGRAQIFGTVQRAGLRYEGGDAGSVNIVGLGIALPDLGTLVPDIVELRVRHYGRWEIIESDVVELRLDYDLLRVGKPRQ